MIFDAKYVSSLVERWKVTKDPKLLEVIIDQSRSLIEAIVSQYDYIYRDDLIQEASLRVQYSLPFYDSKLANLHTYLTTVIKNICLTYLKRQYKYTNEYSIEIYEIDYGTTLATQDEDMLEDLIVRNRERFPSLPVSLLDDASEFILASFTEINKRQIIKNLAELIQTDTEIARLLYTSSMLYLRNKYYLSVMHSVPSAEEFSIYTDIEEIFGKELGRKISVIFNGVTVE